MPTKPDQTHTPSADVAQLNQELLGRRIEPAKICNGRTELVIEGFPRSGNSFLVGVLQELCPVGTRLAHHTHRAENMLIADRLGVPQVVLIREPIAAITSATIFAPRPVSYWAERYSEFYGALQQFNNPYLLLDFRDVIKRPGFVLKQIAAYAPFLQIEGSLSEAMERAKTKAGKRAERLFGEDKSSKIGRPDEGRERRKAQVSKDVTEHVRRHSDARFAYESAVSFSVPVNKTEKAALILHPRSSKDGMSSLQNLMVHKDYCVPRTCGATWIGKGFRVFSGPLPPAELRDNQDFKIDDIHSFEPDPNELYFFSSEALGANQKLLQLLNEKFDIKRTIFTLRATFLKELSHYCSTGWIDSAIAGEAPLILPKIVQKTQSYHDILGQVKAALGGEIVICPIEAKNFEARFLNQAFGRVPDKLSELVAATETAEKSVSPLVAVALHQELLDQQTGPIGNAQLKSFLTAAQDVPELKSLNDALPADLASWLSNDDFVDTEVTEYLSVLRTFGCDEALVDAVERNVRAQFNALRQKRIATAADWQRAIEHASKVLAGPQRRVTDVTVSMAH